MSRRAPQLLLPVLAVASGLAALTGEAPVIAAPGAAPTVSAPVLGQSETLSLVAGRVRVRIKGATKFVALLGTIGVPDESEVDASHGRVVVTAATLLPGQTSTALVYQGEFRVHQESLAPAQTHLILSQPLSSCGPARLPHVRGKTKARTATKHHPSKSRHIWVSDKGGQWGTSGRYVSTTVEGTRWLTLDECNRSAVKVAEGVVVVHDLIRNTSVAVSAGHQYAAVQPLQEGQALVPPAGQVFTGETGGSTSSFQAQVGKHPAILGYFASFGAVIGAPLSAARGSHARLFLHISTDIGYGNQAGENISPAQIAQGGGDDYLVRLGEELAQSERPAYIALLPEMNQANNAYSAFNASGSPRDQAHSTANFKQAWRRAVLIVRGGSVAGINRRLRRLHLPALESTQTTLPSPRVAFMWAPQTAGSPDIPANSPAAYYPGSAYVDIVGTDFYSAFPNFSGLSRLYSAYPSKPFGFNEWAMWRSGDPGFARQLFAFVRSHSRIGLMLYNEGLNSDGPFRLKHFPAATSEIRRQLRSPRFLAYAPEWASKGSGGK
jgi:hypothetical protein